MTAAEIFADPAASNWLKAALDTALRRDPVDAAKTGEILARALAENAERMFQGRGAPFSFAQKRLEARSRPFE